MGEDESHVGEPQRQFGEGIHRRHAAPGVDQDRNPSIPSHPEDCLRGCIAEAKGLRARMQFDAFCAECQASLGFAHGFFGGVKPAIRRQPAFTLSCPRQYPVVGPAVGRTPIGVVQREDTGTGPSANCVEMLEQGGKIL